MWVAHHQGLHKGKTQSMILFGGKFLSFCEKYFEKECSIKNSTFKLKKLPKNNQKATKISTIAYSMKGCSRFFNFIFSILPNLAK
jgi:hypothetical protein